MFGSRIEHKALHMLGKSGPSIFFFNVFWISSLSSFTTATIQTLYLI